MAMLIMWGLLLGQGPNLPSEAEVKQKGGESAGPPIGDRTGQPGGGGQDCTPTRPV